MNPNYSTDDPRCFISLAIVVMMTLVKLFFFMRAFNSASVRRKLSRAADDTRRYQIASVPTLVVAGKYRVSMDNGAQRALQVADWLVTEERKRISGGG